MDEKVDRQLEEEVDRNVVEKVETRRHTDMLARR